MNKEITRYDEEKYFKLKIYDNENLNFPLNYDEIISLIDNKKILLEVSSEDGTKVLSQENYNEIKKTIPYITKIINKPKTFISVKEEKVPVEIVKRINYKAMVHLGKNSNDWHARTITTVKPKNILTDNNEETLDLYENRFIICLIDRISELIAKRKRYYIQEEKRVKNIIHSKVIDMYYNYQKKNFHFYKKIAKKYENDANESIYINKINNELDDIKSIENKLRNLKKTTFYKTLKHKRKVSEPIKKTNIFIFDSNYNKAYKLWNYLNGHHEEKKLEPSFELKNNELENAYFMYNSLCILASLYDLGFDEKTKQKITLKNPNINQNNKLKFENGINTICMWFKHNNIHLSYNYDKENDKWDEFVIVPNIINFEDKNTAYILHETNKILDSLSIYERFSSISSRYCFVNTNFIRSYDKIALPDKICKRFYSIGNFYSNDEDIYNLEKWGNYKTGIQIISPINLKKNFLRIEKIINYHIIKHTNIVASICPMCNGTHYQKIGFNDFECNDCNHKISYTFCNSCDKNHEHPILWIEYKDRRFLGSKEVIDGNFKERKLFDKSEQIETIMGVNAITAFELENENNEWKLKTICPNCGKQLGQK